MKVERLRVVWRDAVWSKVIANGISYVLGALIVAALAVAYKYWPLISPFAWGAWIFFQTKSQVPHWLIAAGTLVSTIAVAYLARVSWIRYRRPKWLSYNRDSFDGVTWRWTYDQVGSIRDVSPFCPHCGFHLYMEPEWKDGVGIRYVCRDCSAELPWVPSGADQTLNRVSRLIRNRIPT